MQFNIDKTKSVLGERTGFIFGFLLFTTVMFMVSSLAGRTSGILGYFQIMGITLIITAAGEILKRCLK